MRIYTSYFAQLRNLPPDIVPVSIAVSTPRWYTGPICKELAPSFEYVAAFKNGRMGWEDFSQLYLDKLKRNYSVDMIADKLARISNCADVVCLCYEKSKEPCHRHLLASYLSEGFTTPVMELEFLNSKPIL